MLNGLENGGNFAKAGKLLIYACRRIVHKSMSARRRKMKKDILEISFQKMEEM
jgi:methyl coenzyme M reductase subunit C